MFTTLRVIDSVECRAFARNEAIQKNNLTESVVFCKIPSTYPKKTGKKPATLRCFMLNFSGSSGFLCNNRKICC